MATYLTGDKHLDQLIDPAMVIVRAVHDERPMHIDAMLADAEAVYGDPLDAARALVVLLAAMVRDDREPAQLLRWYVNPIEYRRLRANGVDADTAAELSARVAQWRKGNAA